jgi:hypothetical protein
MRIRILQVIEATPGFPLRPGRVIEAERLSAEMKAWVKDGRAELVREEGGGELAVAAGGERAVTQRGGAKD